jgi:hypothetical protein
MPFFQNPFPASHQFSWVISDRKYSQTLVMPPNAGRGDETVIGYVEGPYDVSGNDGDGDSNNVLTISFALNDPKNFSDIAITISGATASAVTVDEVIASLEANTRFAEYFTATVQGGMVLIRQRHPITRFRFYVKNGRFESLIKFNRKAGVAELPLQMAKHTIANRFVYADSQGCIIELDDDGSVVDAAIINTAVDAHNNSRGFSAASPKEDWELLDGKSGLFMFKKITVDGSNRITEIIEYSAGSIAGAQAKKTIYTYTAANTNPDEIFEIPYTLQSGDLIAP